MKLESIIHVIVLVQSALFSLVLFSRLKDRPGNLYLAGLLLTVAINFGYNFLLANKLASNVLISLSASYGFLYGPLAYLYAKVSLSEDPAFHRTRLLHFIPFVLVVAAALADLSMMPAVVFVLILSMATYTVMGLRLIYRYERAAQHVLSSTRPVELRWMKFFFYAMALIIVVNLLQSSLYPVVSLGGFSFESEVFVHLSILLMVNIVTVQGLRNPALFVKLSEADLAPQPSKAPKTTTGQYSESVLDQVLERLQHVMLNEKPYTDPGLTVNKLADILDVHPKALSQAINVHLGYNFAEYINSNRIAFAEERLKNPADDGETVMEIMFDAGFNSRSVFNTLFKKKTGLTPSQYRKKFLA